MSIAFKKMRPLLNRIVIKKPESAKVSKGGIILKQTEQINWGTVISVGPGRVSEEGVLKPMSVKVGDHVLLPEYGGSSIKLGEDKEELIIYRDDEVLGILEEKIAN